MEIVLLVEELVLVYVLVLAAVLVVVVQVNVLDVWMNVREAVARVAKENAVEPVRRIAHRGVQMAVKIHVWMVVKMIVQIFVH